MCSEVMRKILAFGIPVLAIGFLLGSIFTPDLSATGGSLIDVDRTFTSLFNNDNELFSNQKKLEHDQLRFENNLNYLYERVRELQKKTGLKDMGPRPE